MYKYVNIISFFFMGLLYGTHMGPILATCIWANPYGTHMEPGCTPDMNMNPELSFNFSETEEHKVGKIIDKLQVKKATGVDKISCKILKLSKTALQSPLTGLINLSVRTSTFPDSIKRAQVTPLRKKNDPMDKTNYRPVSILTVTSKIYEKILSQQLSAYFKKHF